MSGAGWMTTSKPNFHTELLALPAKEVKQVMEKIGLLLLDPTPDAKTKKLLKHMGQHRVCRLRSGDYRILYTYKQPYVTLLRLRRRDDDTYEDEIVPEFLGGLDVDLDDALADDAALAPDAATLAQFPGVLDGDGDRLDAEPSRPSGVAPSSPAAAAGAVHRAPAGGSLPRPITLELLRNLRVPARYHQRLLPLTTQDDLLACGDVPDEHLLRIDEALVARPLEEVLQQPDYHTSVEDLQRYKDGDLLGFLLRLSPEQERFVSFAVSANGPTLVKGGPGTGKSTIALYRTRAVLETLRKAGIASPRILFTTYTKALVAYSEQLLESLLGEDARCVDVRNVDKLVMEHAGPAIRGWTMAKSEDARKVLTQALTSAGFEGNALQQQAQRESLARLSPQYLLEEFDAVIEARALATLDEYLATKRPGRGVPLGATQRRAVWQVYGTFTGLMAQRKLLTWGALRRRAAQAVRGTAGQAQYDAVVIDEAQDLDPNCIRLLVGLCRAANRLFLTADANQAIYGSHFRWRDVHDTLRFAGRTGILTVNYRSTREIGQAAHAYLGQGGLDDEQIVQEYPTRGPRPLVRVVRGVEEEAEALTSFLRQALAQVRLGIGACAVLVPTERAAQAIAAGLTTAGLTAYHMPGDRLDLKKQCVKVITLKSAKGLEFPVVALAGFLDGSYPFVPTGASVEERDELFARERRTLFVGMTRAMRTLALVVPEGNTTRVLHPLPGEWWDGDLYEDLYTAPSNEELPF